MLDGRNHLDLILIDIAALALALVVFALPVPALRLRTRSSLYRRLAKLLHEHYAHPRDLYRLREFTGYFAKNYKFGHHLWKEIQNAPDVHTARNLAKAFFARQEDAGETLV